jgi:hypothetical protein
MSSYAQSRTYAISASTSDVPNVLTSSPLRSPIPSSIKTVSIVAQNGTQNASGFNTFYINGTGYLMPGTTYLRARITPVGGSAGNTYGFSGNCHAAHSILRQLTINLGNVPIELINYYNIVADLMMTHGSNQNFVAGDSAIMMNAGDVVGANTVNTPIDVVIPLFCSGLLNGDRAIPLWLLPSGIQIQIDYDTLFNAITGSAGSTYTGYTVENAQICFQHVDVDSSYQNAVRARMLGMDGNEPALYQLNLTTFMNSKFSKPNATQSSTIGCNLSSLSSALYTILQDPATISTEKYYLSRTIGPASDYLCLVDGQRYNNQQLNTSAVTYAEMNKALSLLGDVTATYAFPGANASATLQDYQTQGFLGGQSFKRFTEDMAMVGSKCSNFSFTLTTSGGEQATDNVIIFLIYDSIVTISATGDVAQIR